MTKTEVSDQVMPKNRPQSIIWFEWLFWGSVFFGLVGDIFFEERNLDVLLLEVIALGFVVLLWYLIARRANNIVKWIYSVLAFVGTGIFGFVAIAVTFQPEILDNETLAMSGAELAFGCITNILDVGSAICLFLKPSRIWFESNGRIVNDEDNLSDVFK